MILLYAIVLWTALLSAQESELSIHLTHSNKDKAVVKTKLALVATTRDDFLDEIMHCLQQDLQASGQCEATMLHGPLPTKKQELASYDAAGYQFVIFLSSERDHQAITGRLYDALDQQMLQGKRWQRRDPVTTWVHTIAHDLWQQLMGQPGSFLSKIVYVKRVGKGNKASSQLCVTDWHGNGSKVVLPSNSILVAPTWSSDGERIFCSQFTDRNVRLIATDLQGKSWVAINRDGTTAGCSSVAGCPDIVYCHSGEIWRCFYDTKLKHSLHQKIVHDDNLCGCPTLLKNGDIIYCAHGKIKRWDADRETSESITDGYCTGPSYHAPSNRLVYSKKVGKWMQLCSHDLRTGAVRQLTQGTGDKIDPSWSPCGNYIVYCGTEGKRSEIMILNTITGDERRISPSHERCSCPAWSPLLLG